MGVIEAIDGFDKQLLLFLNSINSDFGDILMWIFSEKLTWLPLILVLLYVVIKNKGRETILVILGLAIAITLADQVASSLFKPVVERLRPSRDPSIMNQIHIVNGYRGGKYGFVSSHAANVFAVAVFTAMLFRERLYSVVILIWAVSVAYSRIYLGVHYPMDILCGAIVGVLAGYVALWLYHKMISRFPGFRKLILDKPDVVYTSSGYNRKDIIGLSGLFVFFFISVLVVAKLVVEFVS